MQHRDETYLDGTVTTVLYDTTAGTVTTTVDGVQTDQRPITAAETQRIIDHEQVLTEASNQTTMVTESDDAVDKLITVIDHLNTITGTANTTINANPASFIKDVARELKTVARQVNREARLTSGRTESTDTGAVLP